MENFQFSKVRYYCRPIRKPKRERTATALGFDSEADRDGNTFMYCLSDGSVYTPETLLAGLFTREHRGRNYVVYNLKYEQGAILKNLDEVSLNNLRNCGECQVEDYKYKVVGYKALRISRGKNSVIFWDMFSFFNMSLASAARQFTTLRKIDSDVELYTQDYIDSHWDDIVTYCRRDAEITAELFKVVLAMSGKLGIKPTTFYSIASIGYKYVRENTNYVTVKRFWDNHREVLEGACLAYTGGKFEVTTRGKGYYYEYDINSAYPYEIANLVDISDASVVHSIKYVTRAVYAFLKVDVWVTDVISHSLAYKRKGVNTFPVGRLRKWVTKEEYDYLVTLPGVNIKILKGYWLLVRRRRYPYRAVLKRLYEVKADAKVRGDKSLYFFTWKLTNSIYGKQIQLIDKGDYYEATTCWNPIYGAIITANVRLRVARLQNEYNSIYAVHTDSVLSTKELPLKVSLKIGEWSLTCQGLGIILGSGVYQVGDKVRFRGFPMRTPLFELLNKSPPIITIPDKRALSWREVVFHNWSTDLINRFEEIDKQLNINFDTKRQWDDAWQDGDDALERVIDSSPFIAF